MQPQHPALTPEEVIAHGGWNLRYARVLAIASDEDYGFALVDGNGDVGELEAEAWIWDSGTWTGAGSSGAGPLSHLGPVHTGGQIQNACFAFGSAPGRQSITIDFDGRLHQVPRCRLFRLDPADQVLPADRFQQGRMVGGHVSPDHPDHLVIVIAAGHEPAFASDQLHSRASYSGR
jgi:hypothetical protein